MSCNSQHVLKPLWDADESSPSYRAAEAHLSNCTYCREYADTVWNTEKCNAEWLRVLQRATDQDWRVPTFASSVTLELSQIASDEGQGGSVEFEGDDVASLDLRFLEQAGHPELLGRLGRYDIERVVGSGGMGVVFKAYDSELHRVVAIKSLAAHLCTSHAARKRFAREAQAAAAVLHPNVLPIYNVEADRTVPYIVTQYVSGASLQSRVQHTGPLPLVEALRIARQAAAALAAAHHQGLIHRDVKPANILLEDSTDRVVLGDFGLARMADDASLTRTGIVAGTPHYMSPEQALGESIDARSDLFSLGSVLYFMLAGRPPFRAGNAMAILRRVCDSHPKPLNHIDPNIPREVTALVNRLLAKKPSQRPPSADVVCEQIDQILAALQRGDLRLGWMPTFRPAYWKAGVLAGLLMLTTGWFAWEMHLIGTHPDVPPQTPTNPLPDSREARDDSRGAESASVGQAVRATPSVDAEDRSPWVRWDHEILALENELRSLRASDDSVKWLWHPNLDPWTANAESLDAELHQLELERSIQLRNKDKEN